MKSIRTFSTRFSDSLVYLLGLKEDISFLEGFKEQWNRLCNLYKPRKRTVSKEQFERERREESFLPTQVKVGQLYPKLYEIYLKHKFLPDTKFTNVLDGSFVNTLQSMHEFIGINPYPQETDNSADLAYNIRWKGIILIEYLIILSNKPFRYLGFMLLKLSAYLAVPLVVIKLIIEIFG